MQKSVFFMQKSVFFMQKSMFFMKKSVCVYFKQHLKMHKNA